MIPQDFIQQLLARVDIVEVVGRRVQLRRGGANYIGLCPFHGEKSPSFTVSPAKQFYHCFGCGAHGSAIGFLMEQSGLGYVEAIHELARGAGLTVPQADRADAAEHARAMARQGDLGRLLTEAADFYRARLRETPRAIEYLKRRGVSGEIARRFAIGYSPAQWRALEAVVSDYSSESLLEAGLVIDSTDDGGHTRRYDRFRDRIMFPIRNARAQIIGFGARVIDSGEPKYLNSPETPLFSKGREIYGILESREGIRRERCVVVVEGYMDVVMLACHGIDNAVATLGTATTPEHLRKLVRLADRLVFAFDGDAAGRKAAWRALEISLPFVADDRRIDFLFLPPEHDPDSFVRELGAAAWKDQLSQTVSLSEHLVRGLAAQGDLETAEGRAALLARAAPLLRELTAPALRLQLIHQLAGLSRLETREVERYLELDPPGRSRVAGRERDPAPTPPEAPSARGGWPGPPARIAVRMPVAAPDLDLRLRLLLAMHPGLAVSLNEHEPWVSAALREWVLWLRTLPAASTFANVCEGLRASDPQAADRLEQEGAADRGGLSILSQAEAAAELVGAMAQYEQRWLRRELEQLVASGMRTETERNQYQALLKRTRQTRV